MLKIVAIMDMFSNFYRYRYDILCYNFPPLWDCPKNEASRSLNSFIFGCIYVVILLYCNKNDSWLQITASILQFSKCLAFSIWRIKSHIFQFFWHMVQILFIAHSLVTWFLRLTFHFQGSFWYICTFRMCQLVHLCAGLMFGQNYMQFEERSPICWNLIHHLLWRCIVAYYISFKFLVR